MTAHYDPPAMSWGEVANLTHARQVEAYGFCGCEDGTAWYDDCPATDDTVNIYGDMPPSRFRFGRSHFGGNPYAECECGATFLLFTDYGDLMHDCPLDRAEYRCDGCGDHVPDGQGHYIDDDEAAGRYCRPCHRKY